MLEFESLWDLLADPPARVPDLWGDGLVRRQSLVVVHSTTKRGKSMFTQNIALAGCLGWPQFLDIPLHTGFSSVIFQKEIDRRGMYDRTQRMMESIKETRGPEQRYVLHNKSRALRLSEPSVWREFRAFLRDQRPDLVILDPLAHVLTENENDNTEVGLVLERISTLREDPGCAIIVVHHNRKESQATGGSTPSQMARGADRIVADADVVLSLVPRGRHPLGPLSEFHIVSRYGPSLDPFYAVFNEKTFWFERIYRQGKSETIAAWLKQEGPMTRDALVEKVEREWKLGSSDPSHPHRAAMRRIKAAMDEEKVYEKEGMIHAVL